MPHLIRQLSLPFAAFLFATCLPAQGPLGTITGTVPQGQLGTCLREVGDVDGDGVRDFAASEPGSNSNTAGAVRLYSGATRNLLQTFQGVLATGMWGLGSKDVCVVGDVNGDGTTDFAAGYVNRGLLDVFSGATGARLYRMGPTLEYFQYACCVGDRDADGRDDFAALVYVNSTVQLWTIKGNTGTQLSVIDAQPQEGLLRAVGDLDGDGSDEFVRVGYGTCDVYRMNPPARLRRITLGSNAGDIGFADWNGDGRQDLVVQYDVNQQPCVQVFNLFTGAQLRSYTLTGVLANSTPQGMAVLGDCDQDGTPDFALRVSADPINAGTAHVAIFSGASGLRIGDWPGSPQFPATGILQGLGDVNGDAFPDFVMASPSYQSGGGLQVVSARTFATMAVKPVNCYAGPFPPQLGMTRPVLGAVCTIAGRDAPAGTPCFLVLSPMPAVATNLGAPGCDAWFWIGAGALLGQPTARPDWSLQVPVPNVRQLVGLEIALQAYYVGTASPLGYDLTNGLWARLGY